MVEGKGFGAPSWISHKISIEHSNILCFGALFFKNGDYHAIVIPCNKLKKTIPEALAQ